VGVGSSMGHCLVKARSGCPVCISEPASDCNVSQEQTGMLQACDLYPATITTCVESCILFPS
jgi:hypothetical protein